MGSLFAALTTAVSGLNAQSSAIGNISDNLANAQTTGYKSVGTEFEELVNASNAAVNNPGGVRSTPQYQNDVQGSITSSNTATSLAISGSGYFAVEKATTDSAGDTVFTGSTYYTRQGDFTLDKNGYVVNGSGYYLEGYGVTDTGSINTSTTAPIQISALLNDPVAAKTIDYSANLPSNAAVGYTSTAATLEVYDAGGTAETVNYSWTKTGTNAWNLNVSVPNGTDGNGNTFSAQIPVTFNDGTNGTTAGTIASIGPEAVNPPAAFTIVSKPTGAFTIGDHSFDYSNIDGTNGASVNVTVNTLNADGSIASSTAIPVTGLTASATTATAVAGNLALAINQISAAKPTWITATATNPTATSVSLAFSTGTAVAVTPDSDGATGETTWNAASWAGAGSATDGTTKETIPSDFTPTAVTTAGANVFAGIDVSFNGLGTQPLQLNFGTFGGSTGVTQFADTNSTVSVSNFTQDGLPKGSFNSVSIDNNGFVSLNYSNGTNKIIAQVPLAQFYAEDQLQRVTGGAYESTLASGSPRLGAPGTQGAGTLSSNSLEQSNVDIATQFTDLIQAQQVYSANAKVVTTDNSLLQVTLNMIQ